MKQEPRNVIQVRGDETKRQAKELSLRFGLAISEIVRLAIAKLYLDVKDERNVKKGSQQ